MATNVIIKAHGSLLYSTADRTESSAVNISTAVAKVRDINGPNQSVASVDVTTQDGTAGYMEYRPGLVDPGDISGEIMVTGDEFALLDGYMGDSRAWKITFGDAGGTYLGPGHLTDLSISFAMGEWVVASFAIKCEDQWAFAKGT
jgi:hypothetical protein